MHEKKTFMVVYDYGQGGIWFLMDAYSKEDIEALRPEFVVYGDDNLPSWMTPERREEFIANCEKKKYHWDIDKEFTGWLAMCLSHPWPKGSTARDMILTMLSLNGNNVGHLAKQLRISKESVVQIARGKLRATVEQMEAMRALIKEQITQNKDRK